MSQAAAASNDASMPPGPGPDGQGPPDPDRGFSMVEVLISMAVLTISLLAAIQSQLSSLALTAAARETSLAIVDLESAMESILGLPTDEIPIAGSEFEAGQPVARYSNLHLKNQTIVANYPGYTVGNPIPDTLTIILTVTWKDPKNRTRTITVRSAKTR